MLTLHERGRARAAGGFVLDRVAPAELGVITRGHAGHCRPGSGLDLVSQDGAGVVRERPGDVPIRVAAYGERVRLDGVTISLHPAGHALGSARSWSRAAASAGW